SYARQVLEALRPEGIKNHVVTEFFWRAQPEYVQLLAETFENFNIEMSPETHDDELRALNGKPYTSDDFEASVELALDHGCRKFDVYFMTGLARQTRQSVEQTMDYAQRLAARFDSRLNMFVSPLAPFLDPGTVGFENAERFGYKILFRDLESHRQALLQPSWKYTLNYETDAMDRDQIVEATYDAALRLNRIKGEAGFIDEPTFAKIDARIRLALEVKREIDQIMLLPEDQREAELERIRHKVRDASADTICDGREIKWPVLRRNFNIFKIGWDVIFGPSIR
ncbi:MAG: hypothetical protein P9M14_01225, partial [Candidatus Alcyoniella australis]|nr:hypothetical protein [Candidatus Alcyoniella australis]